MKRAIVFPGQGSQMVGMGKDFAEAIPECKALFDQANEILGTDIANICFEGPQEELNKSNNEKKNIGHRTHFFSYFDLKMQCHVHILSRRPFLPRHSKSFISVQN